MRSVTGGEARLASVLDDIYCAPAAKDGWPAALASVADFVGASAAALEFFDGKLGTCKRRDHAGFDDHAVARLHALSAGNSSDAHPRLPIIRQLDQDEIFVDSDVWSETQRNAIRYFTDVFQRTGWNDGITAMVRKGGADADAIVLGAYFGGGAGAPSAEARSRVSMLLPHIRRACSLEESLGRARRESLVLGDFLDRLTDAVALVDAQGRVKRANRAAHRLFGCRCGRIGLGEDARINLQCPDAMRALARAISHCARSAFWSASGATWALPDPIIVARPSGQPLVLTLRPLSDAGAFGATAMLFLSDAGAPPVERRDLLRATFGLTEAESQLAQALVRGSSLKEYASCAGISYESARTYLRRIMLKTKARKQSDLVRIASALR